MNPVLSEVNNNHSGPRKMDQMHECICFRPKTYVLCINCGNVIKGRVRHLCPKHPRVLYINDFAECPKCHMLDYILQEVEL